MTAPRGVDVSSYNPADYGTAGIGFVFVKATEGTGYVNPRHAAQVAHGRASGLVIGHYHFVRPGSMSAQVSYFLQHANPAPWDVLALDWEDAGVTSTDKDAFLKGLKAAIPGHKAVLYCNLDFWRNRDHSSYTADGLWIADPDAPAGQPRIQHPWLFHQYGEASGLDLDIANFSDQAALRAWAAGTTPAPAPTPEPDMQATDKITVPAGTWTKDPQTWTVGEWIAYGNLKADRAAAQAAAANAALKALTAQVAALTATVGALAKGGGLTAEQITAAAKAGADEALAQLGHALDGTQP